MNRLVASLALAACTAADGGGDRVVVDTLPSGAVRVTSEAPTGWRDPAEAWRLVEAQVFAGEEGTDAALVEPQSLTVDAGGRVYVADRKPAVIKVFSPRGELIRTIGREGAGPGEFRVAFIAGWSDRLVVHDPQQSRTSVFDSAGAYLTSWRSACCYWTQIGADTAGRVYVPAPGFAPLGAEESRRGQPWIRYRMDGTLVDTLWIPGADRERSKVWTIRSGSGRNQMVMQTGVPFSPVQAAALHPWGGFLIGWSGEYTLVRSRAGADTTLLIRRVWQPQPIPESVRIAEVEQRVKGMGGQVDEAALRAEFRLADVPTSAPAFSTLAVARDGYVWARQVLGSDSTRTTFDLFDSQGRWVGPVTVPAALPEWGAVFFGSGELYAAVEDQDGRPVVKRWRLLPRR